jgi:hypothetical protein
MNTSLSLKLVGTAMALTVAACGGGGGDDDPISSAISGGGSTTGTVAAPATGSATTTQTPSPNTTTGYTKATLSGVFSRCPVKGLSPNGDWWACMSGLEFVGSTTFGNKVCSMRVRNDGAFEYTSNGITKTTPTALENLVKTGSYGHSTTGSTVYHYLNAEMSFLTQALINSGEGFIYARIDLNQVPGNVAFDVTYQGESCSLSIQ